MNKISAAELERIDSKECHNGAPFTGIAEAFYEDGTRYYRYQYENGVQHGETIKWHSDGSFSHMLIMANGETVKIVFPHELTKEEIDNL
ncbi:hypothetical protein [Microbulbifer sp. SSSA005]|uniref:hypothetical protein n=1 Tax=Microbulbifer sp. SSSA005 TaxID=3243378 RepID=UPI00403A752B